MLRKKVEGSTLPKFHLVTRFERVLETNVKAPEEIRKCIQLLNELRDIGPFDFLDVDVQVIRWAIESDEFVSKFYPEFNVDNEDTNSPSFCLAVMQLLERRVARWTAEVIQAARSVPVEPEARYLRTTDGQELLVGHPIWFGAANSTIYEEEDEAGLKSRITEMPSDDEAFWSYAALNN